MNVTNEDSQGLQSRSEGFHLATSGWVVFVVLMLYAVLIAGGFAGIYLDQLRAASLAITAVGLGAWLLLSLRDSRWRPSTAIWPTLVLPIVALLLATAASERPRLGVEYVAWAVLLVGLYLLLVSVLATQTARERIGALAAMLALVIGLLYLGTVFLVWLEWWGLVGGIALPPLRPLYGGLSLGGPGTVQTVQVLTTAVAIAALGLNGRGRQALAVALVVLAGAVVVLTASRSGWVALAGASVLTGGLCLLLTARSRSAWERLAERWRQRHVRVTAVVAIVIGAAATLLVAPVVLDRLLNSGAGGRDQYFTVAWRLFLDAPLLGHGPGTWAVRRAAFTEPGELDHYIPHAHDIYLQTLAELGVVGAALGLLALVPLAWLVWRALRTEAAETRRWAWCAVFVLAFLGLFNVLDFQMNVPAVFVLGALPIAWLDASSADGFGLGRLGSSAATWVGRLARAGLWVGCLVAVLVLARVESVALVHQGATASLLALDWDEARSAAAAAFEADPDLPAYAITRGLVASAEGDWETAADAYRFAAQSDDMPQSWLGLAQAQAEMGASAAQVAESVVRALRIGEQQPSIVLAAGVVYDRIGLTERADQLYAETLSRYPSVAADPFWTQDPNLASRFDRILALAAERTRGAAWELALMVGDQQGAHALVKDDPLAGSVIEAWQGDAEALAAVFALADAAPDSASLLSWASRLAARAGDLERADRHQRLAVFEVIEGGELPGTEIRVDSDGYLDAVPAGTKVGYAGHYLYRRALVPDLLPPGLPRLVFAERRQAVGD